MKVPFEAAVKYNGKIYFSAMGINGLFSYDISTHITEFICEFAKERGREWLHNKAFLNDEKMWLIPQKGSYIAEVNLKSMDIDYYGFDELQGIEPQNRFNGSQMVGNSIYLKPNNSEQVYVIDTVNEEVSALPPISPDVRNSIVGFASEGKNVFVVFKNGYTHDIKRIANIEIKDIAGGKEYISCIQKENSCLLIPYNAQAIKEIDILDRFNGIEKELNGYYYHGIDIGESAVLFSANSDRNIAVVNWNTLNIEVEDFVEMDAEFGTMAPGGWFEMEAISSDSGSWVTTNNGYFFEISEDGIISDVYNAEISSNKIKELIYLGKTRVAASSNGEMMNESELFGLQEFLLFSL